MGLPPGVCVHQPPPPVPGAHPHSGHQLRHDLQEDQDLGQTRERYATLRSEKNEQEKENKLYSHHNINCIFCLLGPSQYPQRHHQHRKPIYGDYIGIKNNQKLLRFCSQRNRWSLPMASAILLVRKP